MKVKVYEKNRDTGDVKFFSLIEDVISIDIVCNTAMLKKEETHYFDLDKYALAIKNDV